MVAGEFFVFLTVYLSFFSLVGFAEAAKVVQEEVDALEEIAKTMGSKYWKFNADSCQVEMVGVTELPPNNSEASTSCSCNSTDCHVTKIVLKGYNLPGVLPPQLVKLPQLQEIDFALNYLHGTIPPEWATTQLTSISVLVNRLSGEIPKELGNITTLTYICLDANQFSGVLPPDLGKLIHLDTLMLSSNQLTGKLPQTLAGLTNLTNFRINDNNFNGTIPDFIQNWKKLTRLELHASGLDGPIPASISLLNNLQELRISDIGGPSQPFPILSNATGLIRVVLRNCNLSGNLPVDLWKLQNLEMLDVSFNKLVGTIPAIITAQRLRFVFLNGNSLSGDIPESIMKQGSNIDLSYNNFALQGPEQPACRENLNLNLNLFKSSSAANSTTTQTLPCMKTFSCRKYSNCLHVNSGGKDITVKENKTSFTYEGDGDVVGGAAKYFFKPQSYWGFSSTGDFMDDFDYQNTRYTVSVPEPNIPSLYSTARISPISLTYFHYCLENGQYRVKLHFAELQFTNDNTYGSLGKRMFDVYVQGHLVWTDLNIEDEAGGVQKPLVKELLNVNVTNHALEIRFYFAGKGTTRIPVRGVYGPIISGISVTSDSSPCSNGSKKNGTVGIIVGVVLALCLISILLGILWWKGCFSKKRLRERDTEGFDFSMKGTFSLKEIRAATNDFDPANKIGEGGFGPVYKGVLQDSTVIAVKQLSSKSKQGNREFLNEMGVISCIQHPNLVKLHGCCVERDQLLLVYEYMENNSLARALFGYEHSQLKPGADPGIEGRIRPWLKLDWPTRRKICLGIARGLAYLHEESRLKIVHRDIKATNVLLDGDLNPKISDFGLAKLDEEEKSHISTRVAGTIGYMAPEYALWGYLTDKADVYSFGVLLLEIVTGKSNNNYVPNNKCVCLLDWACHLQQSGDLMELIDEKLQGDFKKKEAETLVKVALLCSNASATVRPTMTEVVCMLEGKMKVPDTIQESNSTEDLRFKAMRGLRQHEKNQSLSSGEAQSSATLPTFSIDSASDRDFYNLNPPEPRT